MSRTYRRTWSSGPDQRKAPDGRQQHTPQRRTRLRLAAFETESFEIKITNKKGTR